MTGIRATHVPYRGNPPTLLALMSGEMQAAMVISTSLLPLAKEGKVKMLAYSDTVRSEVITPDVPTVAEQGFKDFQVVFSYVLMVPAGTPQAVIDILHAEATTRGDVARRSRQAARRRYRPDRTVVAGIRSSGCATTGRNGRT